MNTKFDRSVRMARIHFQVIHQDIFENRNRFSVGFMANLMVFIIMACGIFYTILNYDLEIAFNAAIFVGGVTQVRIKRQITATKLLSSINFANKKLSL